MTVDEIIEEILVSEGPGDPAKNFKTPGDLGGRTNWGISESAHPDEWRDGKVPSRERAKEIYRMLYIAPWEGIENPKLLSMIVDMNVLHGRQNTLRIIHNAIQRSPVGYTRDTFVQLINDLHDEHGPALINAIVAHRCGFMARIANAPSQRQFLRGWINRAVKFLA